MSIFYLPITSNTTSPTVEPTLFLLVACKRMYEVFRASNTLHTLSHTQFACHITQRFPSTLYHISHTTTTGNTPETIWSSPSRSGQCQHRSSHCSCCHHHHHPPIPFPPVAAVFVSTPTSPHSSQSPDAEPFVSTPATPPFHMHDQPTT